MSATRTRPRLPTVQLYHLQAPDKPRWAAGDQYPRKLVRLLLRPFRIRPPFGLTKVTGNLCLGLRKIGQPYVLRRRPVAPPAGAPIGIQHGPIDEVRSLARSRRCVTGVGVLNFPDEWPTMFEDTQVAFHLQLCEWSAAYYRPVFGDRVRVWPVGIDTEALTPPSGGKRDFDFLVYNKLRWPRELPEPNLREELLRTLAARGLTHEEIVYGGYREEDYHAQLRRCRAMLFLCESETQGIAYNEALCMGVPLLAWNPGRWLDPNRLAHGLADCPASTVPYWDERCGEQFEDLAGFPRALELFLDRLNGGVYRPRDYILENLTLEKCARHYVDLLAESLDSAQPARSP